MAEYIDKTALIKEGWILSRIYQQDAHTMVCESKKIEDIPAVDVAPVRHGRWIWDNDAIDWGLGAWVCSECHGRNENIHAGKPGYDHTIGMSPYRWAGSAYCPNCGAKMDKEVGE